MNIRVILWGIGEVYNSMVNLLRFYADLKQIEIVGITAKVLPDYRYLDGYKLLHIKEVKTVEYDYILVLSDRYFKEIVGTATEIANVPFSKIIPYRILKIPYFNFEKYDSIRKQNISIVSNNCWGGVICHTLGIECLSPFKNVSFSANDYLKVISDLKYYLSIEPVWNGKREMDSNQNKEVPMLQLGDVFIKCNHDFDAETAIKNWKRRRDKFNWDNILVEMYTEDSEVEREFIRASAQYTKKVCFVPYESKEKYSVSLPLMQGQKKFYEAVNANAGIGKNALIYNILDIMDGGISYRSV